MQKTFVLVVGLVCAVSLMAQENVLNVSQLSDEEKTLYAFGLTLSQAAARFTLSQEELQVVIKGLRDGVAKHPQVDINDYMAKVYALGDKRLSLTAAAERKAGELFRAEVLKEPGATKKESGLIIIPIRAGTGRSPTDGDTITMDYTGTLRDGTVFDTTEHEKPLKVVLHNTGIPCLVEGLKLMRVGERSRFVCPPELTRGIVHPLITPGSTLIYDMTLLDVSR